jgi:acyl-CoA hydrolase
LTNKRKEKKCSESIVQMTEVVLPQHTNSLGTVFGGVVLSWVDIAAAICAQKHCNKVVVTASIDAMNFLAPIHLGWIVNIRATLNYAFKTSCEVGVRIEAENALQQEYHHTASAYVTMVAIDSNGKPALIPTLTPQSEEEKRRALQAQRRRKMRLLLKDKKNSDING